MGLVDCSSRPTSCPTRTAADVEAQILKLRAQAKVGPRRIASQLGLCHSTVSKVLARHQVPRLGFVDKATGEVLRYERERPGELLHVDIKKVGRIPEGGGWRIHGNQGHSHHRAGYDYLHTAVDDRTRIAYVEVLGDEKGASAAGFLRRAVEFYRGLGIEVERVLTDNGFCYTRARAFRQALAEIGTQHRLTRYRRPQTNGKVERFHRTLKDEWMYSEAYLSNQQRSERLGVFLHHYNAHRPHQGLRGQTPLDTLAQLSGAVNDVCGHYI